MTAYAIYDKKAEIYHEPIFYKREEEITAEIKISFSSKDYQNIQPIEFDLFELGSYDTNTAKFNLYPSPKHVYNIQSIIKKDK